MEQPQYSLFHRATVEKDYLPLFERFGLGTTTWSPLASGILTGKYNEGVPEGSRLSLPSLQWLRARLDTGAGRLQLDKVRRLQALGDEAGLPVHHLALLWVLENPHVSSVILGASRIGQLVDNLDALGNREKMTPELLARIEEIVDNKPEPAEQF